MWWTNRLGSAPISWGVCEVPGWGIELPADRVLAEMASLGLTGTELGSAGYLPADPGELATVLGSHDLELIGGFIPVVIHDPAETDTTLDACREAAELMASAGATALVTCPVQDWGWAEPAPLNAEGWRRASEVLEAIDEIANGHGMVQAIHPHLGTLLESATDVELALANTSVGWTFDMGHLLIGGTDPLEFARSAGDRIRHAHLKDVHLDLAAPVLRREKSIMEGVQAGMFCNLGAGDVPIAEIVALLHDQGFDGWYVIEQDAAITGDPPPHGEGPILDVSMSIEYLRSIAPPSGAADGATTNHNRGDNK